MPKAAWTKARYPDESFAAPPLEFSQCLPRTPGKYPVTHRVVHSLVRLLSFRTAVVVAYEGAWGCLSKPSFGGHASPL